MPMRVYRWLKNYFGYKGVANDVVIETHPKVVVLTSYQLNLLDLHNTFRQSNGLDPLKINIALNEAAQAHASWMALHDKWTHFGPDGEMFYTREKKAGYVVWSGGENLGRTHVDEAELFNEWTALNGHRNNILSPAYMDVGFGRAVSKTGITYWVANYGSLKRDGVPQLITSGTVSRQP